MKKPIRVFWSELSNRFYAVDRYRIDKKHPNVAVITGEKYDVTNDIASAIKKYEITFREVKP